MRDMMNKWKKYIWGIIKEYVKSNIDVEIHGFTWSKDRILQVKIFGEKVYTRKMEKVNFKWVFKDEE
jgi:hypothetical protein